ncbi:Upstream activation factor subunit spp27 [Bienertia sinuspersici]
MVSDTELAEKVHEFLRESDLKKTTNNIVIKKLESDFGIDLSHKKPFLRNQVDRFLQSQYNYSEEDEDDDAFDRDGYGNEDFSDSDDDFCDDDAEFSAALQPDNGTSNFNNITKFQRSRSRNKVRNKRVCESGKFCTLSPQLQKFLGTPHMTRTEVVKRLWSYVREKNLQDPQDGKSIVCDETLRELLGVDSINILQINKALTKHIWPVKPVKRDRSRKQEREEEPLEAELKEKPAKKVYSGFLAPLPLSDTLIRFLGTGESALTRADVIKRVWEYIKDKNLQDPFEKKTVICDEKLKELFNVDSFHGFTVSKLLSAHFVKL